MKKSKKERIEEWNKKYHEKVVLIVKYLLKENNITRKKLANITNFSEEQIEDMFNEQSKLDDLFVEKINERFNLKLKR